MGFDSMVLLDELVKKNVITLGRGRVISTIDLANNPGIYPVYSSSSQNEGLFGTFDLFDFDEELITWSVDGGGYFFHRPMHRYSVTNVSGILRILQSQKINYKFLYFLLAYQHSTKLFDYVDKAHPSVIRKQYFIPEIDILEQQKIAEIFSKVDKALAHTKALIDKYNRIKTGLMQDLLTKGIDEQGNIRSEATHEFKDSSLGRIPKEWKVTTVGALCIENVVGIVVRPTQYYIEAGVPMLRSFNIKEGEIIMKDLVYMSKTDNEMLFKSKLKLGDVVSVRTGNPGTSAVITEHVEGCNCIDLVISRVKHDILNSNYLVLWLNSFLAKRQIINHQNGIAQQHFNVGQMKNLLIYQVPIKEQNRVLNHINSNNHLLLSYIVQLSKLQSLKTGLMQDLLSGKVRINHLLKKENVTA